MTPQEKAEELCEKYSRLGKQLYSYDTCKKCALIAVELRLEGDFIFSSIEYGEDSMEYWEQVKKEIENL